MKNFHVPTASYSIITHCKTWHILIGHCPTSSCLGIMALFCITILILNIGASVIFIAAIYMGWQFVPIDKLNYLLFSDLKQKNELQLCNKCLSWPCSMYAEWRCHMFNVWREAIWQTYVATTLLFHVLIEELMASARGPSSAGKRTCKCPPGQVGRHAATAQS